MSRYFKPFILLWMMITLVIGCKSDHKKEDSSDQAINSKQRIISLNGAVTEIISAFDQQDQLVGRDVTSTHPKIVQDSIKDLGHVSSISIEAMMDLNPDLIMASSQDMEEDLESKIKESGVTYASFEQDYSVEGTKNLIKEISKLIGSNNTDSLFAKIDADLEKIASLKHPPKVLFIYARGAGTMMVAGTDTPMAKMIELAGGKNAAHGFKDFKPLTEEALLNYNPEVILLFDSGLESLGGKEGLLKTHGISETKAGKNEAIITMDGGLLSEFGPRVGEAAYTLNELLQPYAQ